MKITSKTHGQLACLNWQTLSDQRAAAVRPERELHRAAFIMTGACNFACPYCKTLGGDRAPTLDQQSTLKLVQAFRTQGLRELRISGGEPTLVTWLPELVHQAHGMRVALSTNGYSSPEIYQNLVDSGVSEFSVSLDSMDPAEADRLSGGRPNVLARVMEAIRTMVKAGADVYIGMTCCANQTLKQMQNTIEASAELGVTDVKIMSLAQEGTILDTSWLSLDLAARFPFLAWRAHNFQDGRDVRGLTEQDSHKCPLVLDDVTIAGDCHYPCNVYFREGGSAIGKIKSKEILAERAVWFTHHDTHRDSICRTMCMDLLRTYNNRVRELQA